MEGNTDRIGCTKRTQRLYSSDDDDDDDVVVVVAVVVVVLECCHSLDQKGGWKQLIAPAGKRNRMDSIASAQEMAFRTQEGAKPVYSVF